MNISRVKDSCLRLHDHVTTERYSREAMILAAMNAILAIAWRTLKNQLRSSTGFEPVTSRCRCDVLTKWALKPLVLRASRLWVFSLLYTISKIAFITARIIASLDFISAVQYMIHFILEIISFVGHSSRGHLNRKWPWAPNISGFIA